MTPPSAPPTKGPIQNTQWSAHTSFISDGPKLLAGLMLVPCEIMKWHSTSLELWMSKYPWLESRKDEQLPQWDQSGVEATLENFCCSCPQQWRRRPGPAAWSWTSLRWSHRTVWSRGHWSCWLPGIPIPQHSTILLQLQFYVLQRYLACFNVCYQLWSQQFEPECIEDIWWETVDPRQEVLRTQQGWDCHHSRDLWSKLLPSLPTQRPGKSR